MWSVASGCSRRPKPWAARATRRAWSTRNRRSETTTASIAHPSSVRRIAMPDAAHQVEQSANVGNRPTQGAPNLATQNRQHTRVGSAPTWRCRTGSALGHVDPRRAALGTQSINALQRSASSRRDNHRVSDAGVLSRNAAPCVHHQRCMHARRPVDQSASVMVTDSMTTGVVGRSPAPVGTFCIRSTSSTPFTVWPKRL